MAIIDELRRQPGARRRRAVAGRIDEPRRPGRAGAPERERRRSQPELPVQVGADRRPRATRSTPAPVRRASQRPRRSSTSISQLRPDIVIWYHQDLFVISPAEGREGRVRARYAELTNWPMGGITGGTYTGVAATWARNELIDRRRCRVHRRTRARRCRPRTPNCTPTPCASSAPKAEVVHRCLTPMHDLRRSGRRRRGVRGRRPAC